MLYVESVRSKVEVNRLFCPMTKTCHYRVIDDSSGSVSRSIFHANYSIDWPRRVTYSSWNCIIEWNDSRIRRCISCTSAPQRHSGGNPLARFSECALHIVSEFLSLSLSLTRGYSSLVDKPEMALLRVLHATIFWHERIICFLTDVGQKMGGSYCYTASR